jgi:hypothetical protein
MAVRKYRPTNPIVRKLWQRAADLDELVRSHRLSLEDAVTKFVQPLGERGARLHTEYAANRLKHDPEVRGIEFTITSTRRGLPDRDGDTVVCRGCDPTDWARARAETFSNIPMLLHPREIQIGRRRKSRASRSRVNEPMSKRSHSGAFSEIVHVLIGILIGSATPVCRDPPKPGEGRTGSLPSPVT